MLTLPNSLEQVKKVLRKYRKCCCREKRLTPAVFGFHRLLHDGTFITSALQWKTPMNCWLAHDNSTLFNRNFCFVSVHILKKVFYAWFFSRPLRIRCVTNKQQVKCEMFGPKLSNNSNFQQKHRKTTAVQNIFLKFARKSIRCVKAFKTTNLAKHCCSVLRTQCCLYLHPCSNYIHGVGDGGGCCRCHWSCQSLQNQMGALTWCH